MVLCNDVTDYNLTNIIPLLMTKLPNALTKLDLDGGVIYFSLSFITNFKTLQELILLFHYKECFKDFEKLQYTIFPQLQILIIKDTLPRVGLLIKFLEINGRSCI